MGATNAIQSAKGERTVPINPQIQPRQGVPSVIFIKSLEPEDDPGTSCIASRYTMEGEQTGMYSPPHFSFSVSSVTIYLSFQSRASAHE